MFSRFVLLFLLVVCASLPARAQDKVRLQLKWQHTFQFAGYYAAQQLGYYREAGLDVEILPGGPGIDSVREVVSGKADFGIGNSSLLLARHGGQPVVALAVIFQHSPAVLLVRREVLRNGPVSLHGKRIMVEPHSDELLAYLRQEGLSLGSFQQVPHSLDVRDLIAGRVDAMTAYRTFEPWFLDRAGFDYQVLSPISRGIDFYGDTLFTVEQQIREQPQRVRAFRAASLRGWQYAMAHPREVIALMQKHYRLPHPTEFYLQEAEAMRDLLRTDLIEIGYMNPVRWLHIADTYADLGLLPRGVPVQALLYQPDPVRDWRMLWAGLAAAAVLCAISLYILHVNRRLARALASSRDAAQTLRHLAQHDPLTGLANRALLAELLAQAMGNAAAHHHHLALMFLDLDGFKPINDVHGHSAGDLLLQEVAHRLAAEAGQGATLARLGGDEFVVLLPQVADSAAALASARKLGAALRRPYLIDGHLLSVSASIGLALYPEHGNNETELMRHADIAMYQAKQRGRDRCEIYQPVSAL